MDLNELLQQAQRLTNETKMDTELPRVERTISQVLQATQEMHARVTQSGTNDLQAHILLGSRGVDLPKLTQKLESLSARKTFEPLDPVTQTDVPGFLKNERENAILSVIEESNRGIFESVEKNKMRCIYAEWGEEKQRLLNALVGPRQEDFPDVQRQRIHTVLPDDPAPHSRLDPIETLYAQEITAYNKMHIEGGFRPNLVAKFAKLAREQFDDELVTEMWATLEYMADITPISRSIDPIKARQTAPQFIRQARFYLEKRYKKYMSSIIQKNLLLARRGGVPNIYSLVKSFVSVTFQLPQTLVGLVDVADGRPLWPLVYFSLRSGDWGAAIEFLREASICQDLVTVMMQRLNAEYEQPNAKIEGQLKLEYSNKLRVSTDPYKKAVYAVILACDPYEGHPEVVRTIDDFLWMQLSVLRSDERRDYNVEQLTYAGLQALILEKYGENYFNAREKAPLYFQVLALTGQFESAIEFLARTHQTRPHAVHMAIALNELSMLGAPSCVQKPLLCAEPDDPKPMRRLNLARLIIMYAKAFEQTDTAEALQYYYLLRHFKGPDGRNLLLGCVCDLIVENCDDDMLDLVFGEPEDSDSMRYVGGIFGEFVTMDYDKHSLAGMVGDELVQRSNFESSIKLYFIAGQFDKALKVVSSLLSQVVHQPPQENTMRERLYLITQQLDAVLATRKNEVEAHIIVTYTLLAQLLAFFDYYHAGEHRLATEILAKNNLLPRKAAEVDLCVSNLKRAGTEVIKVLPDVLLAAMDIIYTEFLDQKSKDNGFGSSLDMNGSAESREITLRHLREQAKALTNLAATLPYRMPPDTNKKLVQMEILMH